MVYVSGLKKEGQDGRYCKCIFELQTLNVNYLNFYQLLFLHNAYGGGDRCAQSSGGET